MTARTVSAVAVANERVRIAQVCQWLGVEVPEDVLYGRSSKVRCPFGAFYHSDGGVEPAMRVYTDSNSAYCFSCAYSYTPVTLAARAWDCRYEAAAASLLERIGYKPVSLAQAWAQVADPPNPPSRTLLGEALKTYCRRICADWGREQFQPDPAAQLDRCLKLLDLVHTDEQAGQWLAGAKTVMRRTLRAVAADPGAGRAPS